MIPKKIHYVWVGGKMPETQERYVESWRAHNPDYELVLWNESNIDFSIDFVARAYKEKKWAKVADFVRLWAVHEHGGIYLDTDVEVVKPLDPLLRHHCFYGFQLEQHPTDWVCNAVFGAEKGHWFIAKALEHLQHSPKALFGIERPTQFGPKLVTRLLRDEGLRSYSPDGVQVRDIFVLPTQAFYPFTWDQTYSPECITEHTYAVHLWEKNWKASGSNLVRAASAAWRFQRTALAKLTFPLLARLVPAGK
jgi:mannosyltransferase OCH1-like enzyme